MMRAELTYSGWLVRSFHVSTDEGDYEVTYSGQGDGYESVLVNLRPVVKSKSKLWYVPLFEFDLGSHPFSIEIRVWPWFTLRSISLKAGDKLLYSEG